MAVASIKSVIECDECAERFTVLHDPAYSPPADWSLWDVAEDAVRGGYVEGKSIFDGSCSVQDGRMLCIPCTRRADAADEEAECAACEGSGKIVEEARTTGHNQHSACQMDCEDCDGSGRVLLSPTPTPEEQHSPVERGGGVMRELRLIIAHTIVEELRLQKPDLQEIDNGTGECWLPGGCTPQSAGCVVNIFDIAEAVEREVREALRTTEQHSLVEEKD